MSTDEMVAWLRAQLDADEIAGIAATKGPWHWQRGYPQRISNLQAIVIADTFTNPDGPAYDAEHIVRHDPAHELHDIEAKRRIVDDCVKWNRLADEANARIGSLSDAGMTPKPLDLIDAAKLDGRAVSYRDAVAELVAGYRDRDGYRPEWGRPP
jgi:hypothetical protein